MIKLCEKHYTNSPFQIFIKDERDCKFCIQELYERMEEFDIIDWKKEYREDLKKYKLTNKLNKNII